MRERIAVIDREKCHPQDCGNYLCAKLCPVNRTGSDCITPGSDGKARIDELLCTSCGICPKRCPFGAITIINLPAAIKEGESVHRYGQNLFELFSLPSPLPGKSVGMVGKNGIGKSTVVKILSGVIHPNLGRLGEEVPLTEVVRHFRGREIQTFFDQLQKGTATIAYKPQQVDFIPRQFSGTVRELLQSVDKEGTLLAVADQFSLRPLLDHFITTLSGGELQRVAIAATLLKDVSVYFFDEPTSYLDIKQRIHVAQQIHARAAQGPAVMTIDHDLIVLDYMTDLVTIMYGHEGVYGVASGVKANREGINAYIDGFLREENMRFRSHSLKFEKYVKQEVGRPVPLISWSAFQKRQGTFTLHGEPGQLNKSEVVGILGENGIGKTTFVKLLAGLDSLDTGTFDTKVRVAYKPQYLEVKNDQTVADFLPEVVEKYPHQVIVPLNIEPLYTKLLSQLSGGELQRVCVAKALGADADLLLLDEPSAYLDVEQRLIVAKVIRSVIEERGSTALVVDHDFMFLDTVADRAIVFLGEPAVSGEVNGPFSLVDGINVFLEHLGITMRRDEHSKRPRINKPGSVKDREQKASGKYYLG